MHQYQYKLLMPKNSASGFDQKHYKSATSRKEHFMLETWNVLYLNSI